MNGVSTRAVDDLVQALGIGSGISKSEVSRICAGLDEQVAAFRHPHPAPHHVSLRVPRCHLPACAPLVGGKDRAGVLDGGRGGDRGDRRPAAGRSSASTSATPRTRCFGAGSCAPSANGACPGCGSSSPTNTPAWSPPYGASSRAWRINVSSAWRSTSPATSSPSCRSPTKTWSPPSSGPRSPNPMPPPSPRPGTRSETNSPVASPRSDR